MDAGQVKIVCDSAAQVLSQLGAYASQAPAAHTAEDDALVRQLRVAVGALANALMEVSRMTPPPMPPMPQPAQGAPPPAA